MSIDEHTCYASLSQIQLSTLGMFNTVLISTIPWKSRYSMVWRDIKAPIGTAVQRTHLRPPQCKFSLGVEENCNQHI